MLIAEIRRKAEDARVLVEAMCPGLKKNLLANKDVLECKLSRARSMISFVGRMVDDGSDRDMYDSYEGLERELCNLKGMTNEYFLDPILLSSYRHRCRGQILGLYVK